MAAAADLREIEEACPWEQDDFRADLELLAGGRAAASRMYAADLRVIARLAARVPRCAFDETGSTPWTSFRREVALACRVTDRAAAQLIRCALRLTGALPQAMALLEAGVLTPQRASTFVTELETVEDRVAAQVDAELAQVLALLPAWRIEQAVRAAVLRVDPEAAAARVSVKNAGRGVQLSPDADDQASVSLFGPAVPLVRWYATLDARARALRAAGDPRTLDALRYDLATSTYPCHTHTPADSSAHEAAHEATAGEADLPDAPAVDNQADPAGGNPADAEGEAAPEPTAAPEAVAGLRPSFVEPASPDCRRSRPVQARVLVPVETGLGLSNEPAWLEGYGWISAPTCRQLLIDAELRQACVRAGTGELVDLTPGTHRPAPTPTGLRESLLSMVLNDVPLSDIGWRTEPQHDPSDRLRDYVTLRDRACDGPTGARVPAARAQLDHDDPWPTGPTAAWNLAARGARTHQHKHHGWTPLRTATSTLWISPAGQTIEVPRHTSPPPGIDSDPDSPPTLPDPDELAHLDELQLTAPTDHPPGFTPPDTSTTWTWLDGSVDPPPF